MTAQPVFGFIGLGNMGRPMAVRIGQAGLPLRLWARRPASLEGLLGGNVEAATSPRDLATQVKVVGVCVRTDEELLDIALREPDGLVGGMRAGSVLTIHATVMPATIERVAETAAQRGVQVLDAPVSGGSKGAEAGILTVLLGGDDKAIEIARPMLECFATKLLHVGALGSAQTLKLLNNNLCFANVVASIAALNLATRMGIDPLVAARVMGSSSGNSHALGLVRSPAQVAKMTGPTSNVGKDVAHLIELAKAAGVDHSDLTDQSQLTVDRIHAYAAAGAPGAE